MTLCQVCGVPKDAGFFDRSSIRDAPGANQEVLLASFQVPRNYCGQLLYFAQYIRRGAGPDDDMNTPGYRWELRIDGRPADPYFGFEHIVNPWGLHGFPLEIPVPEESDVQLVVCNTNALAGNVQVGGRLVGRYWYDTRYGGVPNPL